MPGTVGTRQPLSAAFQLIEHVEFVVDDISVCERERCLTAQIRAGEGEFSEFTL